MKIAYFIEEGRLGGPQVRAINISSHINNKFKVNIIFPKKNSENFQKRCKKLNIKYTLLPISTPRLNLFDILKYITFFSYEVLNIFFFFKKEKFDIVHIGGGSWQIKAIIASKFTSSKIIWELNDTHAPSFVRIIFSILSRNLDGIIFASSRSRDYYCKYLSKTKHNFIIQSPVDVNYFTPGNYIIYDNIINRAIKNKKVIVGMIANVSPVKDIFTLAKAIKNLHIHSNNFDVIIIGAINKNQKKYYEQINSYLYQNKISNFYFLKSKEDVRPFLNSIDIYICSSLSESSPLSVWEAMSMQKAIISTNVGDVSKFITNGYNGYIIDVGDYLSLSKRIETLMLNKNLRIEFGKLAREVAKNELNSKKCVSLHQRAYKKILN